MEVPLCDLVGFIKLQGPLETPRRLVQTTGHEVIPSQVAVVERIVGDDLERSGTGRESCVEIAQSCGSRRQLVLV